MAIPSGLFPSSFPTKALYTALLLVGRTEVSVKVRGFLFEYFLTWYVFTPRSCQHLAQNPSWRTTSCRLSGSAYSIYSRLPSILEAVPPSATWGRTMSWWQGSTHHGKQSFASYLAHNQAAACVPITRNTLVLEKLPMITANSHHIITTQSLSLRSRYKELVMDDFLTLINTSWPHAVTWSSVHPLFFFL